MNLDRESTGGAPGAWCPAEHVQARYTTLSLPSGREAPHGTDTERTQRRHGGAQGRPPPTRSPLPLRGLPGPCAPAGHAPLRPVSTSHTPQSKPPPTPPSPSLQRHLPASELGCCSGAHRFMCEKRGAALSLGLSTAHDSQPAGSAAPGGNPVLTACDGRGARLTHPPASATPPEKHICCLHTLSH